MGTEMGLPDFEIASLGSMLPAWMRVDDLPLDIDDRPDATPFQENQAATASDDHA